MMATTADFNSGDSHPQGWARQDTALKGSADSGPGLSLGTPGGVSTLGLPGDAEFPQLAVAGDPARMLEVFRAHLKPARGVGADDIAIEAVMPFRFRCRQRKSRCVLEYTLSLADRRSGRRWQQMVTGVLYATAGEAERVWRELAAADPSRDVPPEWLSFEPVGFVPDLDMLVEVFPYDRKIHQLRRVMSGAGVRFDVEPLLLERLGRGEGGSWEPEERAIEPLRYRTELGAALRYTLRARERATGRRATVRAYLKVYRDGRGEPTWHLLRRLAARAAPADPYAVVAPIAYLADLHTLVLEEAPGKPLLELLLAGRDPAIMRPVARAVAAFNQDEGVPVPREHSRADQLAQVRRAARLVAWACPQVAAEVEALTAAVVDGLPDAAPGPMHRDLKADHVFLDGDRVVFIDLDSVALGDPVRDAAHLYAYLVGGVGLAACPEERVRAAAAAFVDEYFAHVPAAWRVHFPLHCAGALIEVASGMFRRQEPAWRDRVITAVELARRALMEQETD